LSPKLVESGRHPNIKIIANAEVESIQGEAGNFKVTVLKRPRYVNEEVCNACGSCVEYCPEIMKDYYNENLVEQKSLHIPYPQAVPASYVIDPISCLFVQKNECRQCEQACKELKAIDLNQAEEHLEIEVGSVILSPGLDEFDARRKKDYGYGEYPNVITSIEFERILSASGPFEGQITRPSDSAHPKKIAFLQCVGSRDQSTNSYCSSVCCTYAIKEAIVAKEHEPDLDISIFYMDIRTHGKNFERFYERAKNEFGIKFIRSRLADVERSQGTEDLILNYVTDDGEHHKDEFNLLVVSVGIEPSKTAGSLAKTMGIRLNEEGFCQTHEFSPTSTTKDGVFVAGAFQAPKDIPESVVQASGSVSLAAGFLSDVRGTLVEEKEFVPEIDVEGQEPRIGVFVCHCGINVAGVADVTKLKESAEKLDDVVFADESVYACSKDSQEKIKQLIEEHKLNRIVLAACTPRTHEPLFQDTIREAGLNKCLFEMANIRDQCTWVHAHEKDAATQKAEDLLRMGVAKARKLVPLKEEIIQVDPKALVIGGGFAGMTAALSLADQGFECYLVEKEKELGGNLRHIKFTLNKSDTQKLLDETIERVEKNSLIKVHTQTQVKDVSGYIGNFVTALSSEEEETKITHGVIIVATGGHEYQPTEYLHGKHEDVITQQKLGEKLASGELESSKFKDVVMIQCVGSRTEERPYCSRICCSVAIKNALKIKAQHPKSNIYILCRDIRTYGFIEKYYRRAREEGIIFIRYNLENKPNVSEENGELQVSVFESIVGEQLVIKPSLLALSSAIIPNDNKDIAQLLKVPVNEDGFFQEAHVKLRPVDFSTDGIYVCGLAHSPKSIEESLSQANAAATRAAIPLSRGHVAAEPIVSSVDTDKCFGCGICEYLCPYSSIKVVETESGEKAQTITASCKGCGICASKCPRQAISMGRFTDEHILLQISAYMEGLK
jgi:heterodisulfide reductase subunit A